MHSDSYNYFWYRASVRDPPPSRGRACETASATIKLLTRGLVPPGNWSHKQQRIWLRNREIRVRSRKSTKSTYECHPSSYHCLPRRSRRPRAYAGYAISKGFITRASTRWTAIRQQFSDLSAKKALPQGKTKQNRKAECVESVPASGHQAPGRCRQVLATPPAWMGASSRPVNGTGLRANVFDEEKSG